MPFRYFRESFSSFGFYEMHQSGFNGSMYESFLLMWLNWKGNILCIRSRVGKQKMTPIRGGTQYLCSTFYVGFCSGKQGKDIQEC